MEQQEIANIFCLELAKIQRSLKRLIKLLSKDIENETTAQDSVIIQKKLRRSKISNEVFHECVALVVKDWRINGHAYPFNYVDGRNIKRLIRLYDRATTLALIELFPKEIDEWTRANIGLNMQGLNHMLPKILDMPILKIVAKRYESIGGNVGDLVVNIGLKIDPKRSEQAAKMASLKALYDPQV